jgi:hypothetical protein
LSVSGGIHFDSKTLGFKPKVRFWTSKEKKLLETR